MCVNHEFVTLGVLAILDEESSAVLSNLKNMASDMGTEITRQNDQLGRINTKVSVFLISLKQIVNFPLKDSRLSFNIERLILRNFSEELSNFVQFLPQLFGILCLIFWENKQPTNFKKIKSISDLMSFFFTLIIEFKPMKNIFNSTFANFWI